MIPGKTIPTAPHIATEIQKGKGGGKKVDKEADPTQPKLYFDPQTHLTRDPSQQESCHVAIEIGLYCFR